MTKGGARPGAGRPKAGPKFGEWTSVEDALPEGYVRIILTNSKITGEGMYASASVNPKFFWATGGEVYGGPIKWMPLPPPPKDAR